YFPEAQGNGKGIVVEVRCGARASAPKAGRRLLELRHPPIPQGDRNHGERGENPTVRPRMLAVSSAPRGDRVRPVRAVDLEGSEAKARGPQRSVHGRLPSLLRRVHFERPPATAGAQEDRIHGRTADIRSLVQGILRTRSEERRVGKECRSRRETEQ